MINFGTVYFMNLQEEHFQRMKNGEKKYELRLFDDKRGRLSPGDYIVFQNLKNEEEQVACKIKSLHRYASFKELFEELHIVLDSVAPGISSDVALKKIREYYSEQEEKSDGVMAIGLELANLEEVMKRYEYLEEQFERVFPDGMK